MFLLLRALLIWNLISWRKVVSAFKCFYSHISTVLQNIQKPLLQKTCTNNRRMLWIDETRRYHTMVALLHTNEAGKRRQNDILSNRHNNLVPVRMPHATLNKWSEHLSALHDPKPQPHTTRLSDKGLQLPCAQLLLSSQTNMPDSHWLLTQGSPPACAPHPKHSSSQPKWGWHTPATPLLCHTAKWLQKKKLLHAVRYFCW